MSKGVKIARWIGVILCETFVVFTAVLLLVQRRYGQLPMVAVTAVLVTAPLVVERLFRCRIALPLFLFALLYALGPMLGYCYHFYYTIPWWDKMLHVFGGVAFALFGLFLYERFIDPPRGRWWMAAVFALCFSMAVAVAWEFFEYGADTLLGMDMQNDTIVTEITSYLLLDTEGKARTLSDITAVTVNGELLPVRGYIDIGLNDTMWDMLLETAGTLAVLGWFSWDKGKHNLFLDTP